VLYQGNVPTITKFLYNSALVVFGAMVLTFVLVFGFKEYLTRFVFGKKVETSDDLIDYAQNESNQLIDRLIDRYVTDDYNDKKEQIKIFAPRFANWFIWGRLRNWWWQWLIGIATFLVGLVGTLLLINQNELLSNQNTLIQRQMSLEEANRRSSLVVLMSNIMDKVDDEINRQRTSKDNDKTRYKLSASLIGQIAALSHSFKPYRYMDGDSLIEKPLSPERGHLLITLTRLPLDIRTFDAIYKSATFQLAVLQNTRLDSTNLRGADLRGANLSYANLSWADLREADLRYANLSGADLTWADLKDDDLFDNDYFLEAFSGADLGGANLNKANLNRANLSGIDLKYVDLMDIDLRGVDLTGVDLKELNLKRMNLRGMDLRGVDLRGVDLSGLDLSGLDLGETDLAGVDLSGANLRDAHLRGANFEGANLQRVSFEGANLSHLRNITLGQILMTKTLFKSEGLSDSLKQIIMQKNPELFQVPKY
jgi:uncharacterized protein YjbI with pentapeptide repeats